MSIKEQVLEEGYENYERTTLTPLLSFKVWKISQPIKLIDLTIRKTKEKNRKDLIKFMNSKEIYKYDLQAREHEIVMDFIMDFFNIKPEDLVSKKEHP